MIRTRITNKHGATRHTSSQPPDNGFVITVQVRSDWDLAGGVDGVVLLQITIGKNWGPAVLHNKLIPAAEHSELYAVCSIIS